MTGRVAERALVLGARLRMGEQSALEELLNAFRAESGNLTHACERLGLPHRTVARWVAGNPKLSRELERIRKRAGR